MQLRGVVAAGLAVVVAAPPAQASPGGAHGFAAPQASADDIECMADGACVKSHDLTDSQEIEAAQPGPGRPRVFLQLSRPGPVVLFEAVGYQLALQGVPRSQRPPARPICAAPCGQVVDARRGNPFYIGGDGVTPTRGLRLEQYDGEVVVRVKPGRYRLLLAGLPVTWLGAAGTVSGAFFVDETREQARVAGGLALGLGVTLLATGIALIVRGVTRVRVRRR